MKVSLRLKTESGRDSMESRRLLSTLPGREPRTGVVSREELLLRVIEERKFRKNDMFAIFFLFLKSIFVSTTVRIRYLFKAKVFTPQLSARN